MSERHVWTYEKWNMGPYCMAVVYIHISCVDYMYFPLHL